MEQNFQTSFIPKAPMIEHRAEPARPVSFFTIISIFVLFSTLLSSVGLYFYKGIVTRNIAKMENDLNLAKNRFEPEKIAELQVLDKRLRGASEILSGHIIVTPIFEALQAVTMKTVRYSKFGYSIQDSKVLVKISGTAIGYRSVALQSDLFAKNKNLIDPVFFNLTLDEKGDVVFELEFSVDPTFVDYKQTLETTGS